MTATLTEPTSQRQPTTFNVLVADKLAQAGLDWIEQQPDAALINKPGLSEDEYAQMLSEGEIDAMIVRSAVKVTAKMLANPGRLKIIARAGVGVDNIDLEAATAKGILVVNTAEASTITTAEHAFTLLCALARNIGPAYKTMAEGGWDRSKFKGTQLSGKTMGIIGFGRIGQTLAHRALAFGMRVIAFDPYTNASTMLDGQVKMYRDFEAILPEANILSFHVPLNDQTKNMLNRERFAKCPKGVLVVNASRGGVIDEEAIIPAIENGQCGGVALDVYADEPPPEDSPLRTHPKVLCTPHLGASTAEAQLQVSTAACEASLNYLRGHSISGAVNAAGYRVDMDPQQQRFVDLAQRMAALISPMISRGISEIHLELAGKHLHPAVGTIERTALIKLLQPNIDEPLNVINVKNAAEQRGIKTKTRTTEGHHDAAQLSIEVFGPSGAVDSSTPVDDRSRRITGGVYDDNRPRVLEINGYNMDMVPAGDMVLIQNEDKPGIIGLVGNTFGQAQVNIADMSISRRAQSDGKTTALMVLKLDAPAPEDLLNRLLNEPGVLKVAPVKLPAE